MAQFMFGMLSLDVQLKFLRGISFHPIVLSGIQSKVSLYPVVKTAQFGCGTTNLRLKINPTFPNVTFIESLISGTTSCCYNTIIAAMWCVAFSAIVDFNGNGMLRV